MFYLLLEVSFTELVSMEKKYKHLSVKIIPLNFAYLGLIFRYVAPYP